MSKHFVLGKLIELLLSVHGVGPRVAQAILSGIDSDELATAIGSGNVSRLRGIKGVGPKTAERLVLELKGKVRAVKTQSGDSESAVHEPIVRALVGLGYRAGEAEQAVERVALIHRGATAELLLREALRQIQAR